MGEDAVVDCSSKDEAEDGVDRVDTSGSQPAGSHRLSAEPLAVGTGQFVELIRAEEGQEVGAKRAVEAANRVRPKQPRMGRSSLLVKPPLRILGERSRQRGPLRHRDPEHLDMRAGQARWLLAGR